MLDVLTCRTWTSVVQQLRRPIRALQFAGLLVRGIIENSQFKPPAKSRQIRIGVSDSDGIRATRNIGLRRCNRYLAGARIRRHVTFGASFRLLLRRAGVTGGWTSREGVNRTSAGVM